jgi:cellulose synthase/poly-beta-1,6-N-acetylglucosamine synthase-like glycosyltransferase
MEQLMHFFIIVSVYLLLAITLPLCLYLGILAILAKKIPIIEYLKPQNRFAIIVPAHNEQYNIQDTVKNLLSVDYPEKLREIIVVADNCNDQTALLAQQAGSTVWERFDEVNRGKGYALDFAFEKILDDNLYDAVVVVDADTLVSQNLLLSFNTLLLNGHQALQAEYGVRNVRDSWRTKLMSIALGMFHRTRSLARERLNVSVGLRGNGMCFSASVIKKYPHKVYSLVEDVEYGIHLGLSGIRVAFAHDAYVLGEMVSSARDSVSQRQRWEGGRVLLIKQYLSVLIKSAFKQKSLLLWDLAMDIIVPPVSYIAILSSVGIVLEVILLYVFNDINMSLYLWSFALLSFLLYILSGVQHSGLGPYGIIVLLYAPVYIVWKVLIVKPFGTKGNGQWIRTRRRK